MAQKVTKAVIAAAGFGTRFLPQTKAMPKEMLPLVDKPIIQYIVEDLVAAGIKDIIIVGSSNKRSIEDHFDVPSQDLLANLKAGGPSKAHFIEELEKISSLANFVYVRQKGPYGTATPIMNVAHLVGNEPFIYSLADDFTVATPNSFQQMIDLYQELDGSILPCIEVSTDKEYKSYGIISGERIRPGVMKMDGIVEKPGREAAPSNFASVSGFLFTPDIFSYLDEAYHKLPADQEFYLSNYVIEPMIQDGKPFYGCSIKNSQRYDTGDKLEYIKTVIDFALKDPEMGSEVLEFLRSKTT